MNTPNLDKQIERMESDKRQGINTTFLNEKLNEYKSIKEQLLIHSVVQQSELLLCKHCGNKKALHSEATELCPDRFKHFEAKYLLQRVTDKFSCRSKEIIK